MAVDLDEASKCLIGRYIREEPTPLHRATAFSLSILIPDFYQRRMFFLCLDVVIVWPRPFVIPLVAIAHRLHS